MVYDIANRASGKRTAVIVSEKYPFAKRAVEGYCGYRRELFYICRKKAANQ